MAAIKTSTYDYSYDLDCSCGCKGWSVKKTNLIETNLYCHLLLVLIEQMMTGSHKKTILYI